MNSSEDLNTWKEIKFGKVALPGAPLGQDMTVLKVPKMMVKHNWVKAFILIVKNLRKHRNVKNE